MLIHMYISHLKELSEVCQHANLDIINILGTVLFKDRQEVGGGVPCSQDPSQLMQGMSQHTADLPLQGEGVQRESEEKFKGVRDKGNQL